ncbi:MAG: alkaline phosphatase family protein [Flavobacteriia bacterium]|jgi:phosphoglycerol transferase MdoB-like AlkP superfamily enzyme|uniref:LTA synthase family protein n=1 Tax=Flavobacterium sp. TaxID=239 RepID=UPI002977F17B|nr:MAG: alkaline phosphatase family protein [Flavobacteriia bacterium]
MKNLRYLKPIFSFFLIGLCITTISRILLFFIFKERVVENPNYGQLFLIGLRFDLILMSYIAFIPAVLLSLLPDSVLQYIKKFFNIYFIFFLFLFLLMELSTLDFINQYDTRPNRLFLDYLIYPKEVVGTLLKSYLPSLIITTILLNSALFFALKFGKKLFYPQESNYKTKLLLFLVVSFFLFWGARGSLTTKRPINASNAIFCSDQMTNSLGLNSFYTVAFAAYSMKNEGDVKKYGKMDELEAYSRVKKYMDVTEFLPGEVPFLHLQKPDVSQPNYNVVVFLQESLGAEYVGCLNGLPLTPELDKLSKEGLLFTNLYCTGTRSVRGIEQVTAGFLPNPSESIVKLSGSQQGFFTLADAFGRHNYDTSFIYGGMANFDNMASFFNGNGFKNIIDETDFDADGKKYAMKGTWGYSDEDLAVKANEYYKSLGKKPFFSLMFSTSNHEPFEFPDGRIKLYEQPKNTVHNAMKYADFSIGKFFELAKKEAYFKNTIFVVIADHNTRTYGKNLVPVNKFHIPALIIAPNIEKGITYDNLASQMDIPSTVLALSGITTKTPMVGRNLLKLPKGTKGRTIMLFHETYAFRVDDDIVILNPNAKPLQFKVKSDTELIPVALNEELAKDALAHIVASSNMYKNRVYKID